MSADLILTPLFAYVRLLDIKIMKKIVKIFLYNFFFILFFIYLFIFSTNNVHANTYKIENIEISDEYNINFNKEDVIDEAFQKAFKILLNKITVSKDYELIEKQNLKLIKSFVDSFSVVSEKFENKKYNGVFQINFDKSKNYIFFKKQKHFSF